MPTICPRIRRLPAPLADLLPASSTCSMMIIQSDLSKIAPTLLTHNCWQSTSLIAQQIQASMALSTIVISRDRITIAPIIIHHSTDPSYAHLSTVNFSGRSAYPGICGTFNDCHFQRSHYYSTENSSARSVTAIFCGGSAPSIHSIKRSCAYSSTVSFSGAQQLLKSAALSTCVTSRHLTVIELTIHALICRLPSPFADQLSASSVIRGTTQSRCCEYDSGLLRIKVDRAKDS